MWVGYLGFYLKQIFYEGVSYLLEKLILGNIKNRIVNHDKIKKRKARLKLERKQRKEYLINTFGKLRYWLAVWFGSWILFTANSKFYAVGTEKIAEPSIQQPSNVIYLNSYR